MSILSKFVIQNPITNLAALKAINTTSVNDSVIVNCKTLGVFRLDTASSETPDDINVVQPTTGSGRWIRLVAARYESIMPTFKGGTTLTLTAADWGTAIVTQANSAITYTIPDIAVGFWCKVYQGAAGQITFVGDNMNLNSANSALKTRTQHSSACILQTVADICQIDGDLTQ